jgi:hypothetical protein
MSNYLPHYAEYTITNSHNSNLTNIVLPSNEQRYILVFSFNKLLLCYLAMVVGNNASTTMKNAGKLLAISIVMQMRWCNAGHITR